MFFLVKECKPPRYPVPEKTADDMSKGQNNSSKAKKHPDAGTWYDGDLKDNDDEVVVIPSPKEEAAFRQAEKDKDLNLPYKRDMYSLKLPLPLFFWSDREREAHVLNQCENAKFGKLIRHFQEEKNMNTRRLRLEAKLVRNQASKIFPNFYAPDLAKRRTESAPPLSPKENRSKTPKRPKSSVAREGAQSLSPEQSSESDNNEDDDEIDPFIAEFNTLFSKPEAEDGSEVSGEALISSTKGGKCWRTTPSSTPIVTPSPKNARVAFSNPGTGRPARSQSAFAVRKEPPNKKNPEAARCQSAVPSSKTGNSLGSSSPRPDVHPMKRSLHNRRPSYHDPIKTAYLLKQELRRNTRRRLVESPKPEFNIKQEVQNEKSKFKNIQEKIHVYVENLKEFQKPQLNKWSVKDFESKLNLQDKVEEVASS